MSKKEKRQPEVIGSVEKVEPTSKYILEPGREFYLLTCDDEGKEGNSNVLAIDMMSLSIFCLNLAEQTYAPFEAEKIEIRSIGRQKHVELYLKNGSYTGNYSVEWKAQPVMVTATSKIKATS